MSASVTATTTGTWGQAADSLLRTSHKQLRKIDRTSWFSMSDAEFVDLISFCASYNAYRVLRLWDFVETRLADSPGTADWLLQTVASHYRYVDRGGLMLLKLPVQARRAVCMALDAKTIARRHSEKHIYPPLRLIVSVTHDLPITEAKEFFRQAISVFKCIDSILVYRVLLEIVHKNPQRANDGQWMLSCAEMIANRRGYLIGTVSRDPTRFGNRLHVAVGSGADRLLFYAQRPGPKCYVPKEGDIVAFLPAKGRLTGGRWVEVLFRRVQGS